MAKKRSSTDLMTIEDALLALQIDRASLNDMIQAGELTMQGDMIVAASVQALLDSPDVAPEAELESAPAVATPNVTGAELPQKQADLVITLRIPIKRVLQQANRPPKHAAVQRLKESERDILGHWLGGVIQEDAVYLNDAQDTVPVRNFQGLIKSLIQSIKAQMDAANPTQEDSE